MLGIRWLTKNGDIAPLLSHYVMFYFSYCSNHLFLLRLENALEDLKKDPKRKREYREAKGLLNEVNTLPYYYFYCLFVVVFLFDMFLCLLFTAPSTLKFKYQPTVDTAANQLRKGLKT